MEYEITAYYTVIMNFKNSKHKGSWVVAQCIAKLYSLGYEVLLPVGDRMPYDLVFDDGLKLWKVQAKFASKNKKGKYIIALRITGGNQTYMYAKKYGDDDFDYIYTYIDEKRQYLIKWSETDCRNEICLDDQKYQKYLF